MIPALVNIRVELAKTSQPQGIILTSSWQSSTSIEILRLRAALLATIRCFFERREVLEVETPLLSRSTVSDPHIDAFNLQDGATELFLQTSPEYAMKRLLAQGAGPIYQICKSFRRGEQGSRHSSEFTMLEWYRPGFDHHQLMDEVAELVVMVLGAQPVKKLTYRELFQQFLAIDPHTASEHELREIAKSRLDLNFDEGQRDTWLDILLTELIEPHLKDLTFVYDYPTSQAALARIENDEHRIAVGRRFELYVNNIELANGYFELCDHHEQRSRFLQDNRQRQQLGKDLMPIDEQFLAALASGLPECSVVALGLDRLLMLQAGADNISKVISFGQN